MSVLIFFLVSTAAASGDSFALDGYETVAEGFVFTEGPVWRGEGTLLFSDIPADTIYGVDKTVFRKPSGMSNGLTLDGEGRLIACEHGNRRVSRTQEDGTITVLAETFEGKRLNSPNDAVVRADGTVFFTDPPYGLAGGLEGDQAELDFCGVYAVRPGEAPRLLVRDFERPNGLAFSLDQTRIYIADTNRNHLRVFEVAEDGHLSEGREFCQLPSPDGIKVDTQGNVWATAEDGVRVIAPDGTLLETLKFPQQPANCAFGGANGKTLYVTARSAVYSIPIRVPGILPGRASGTHNLSE
jgi:gluconolactonase